MTNACDGEALEALVADELDAEPAKALMAHVMGCAACRAELSALRDDKARFAARAHRHAQATHVADRHTWQRVAASFGPVARPVRRSPALVSAFSALAAALCVAGGWVVYTSVYHTAVQAPGAIPVELKVQRAIATRPPQVLKGSTEVPVAGLGSADFSATLREAPNVRVRFVGGELNIGTTTTDQARLHVHVDDERDVDPAWRLALAEDDGNALRVELRCGKGTCGEAPQLTLELEIPARSHLEVDAVDGDLTVRGIVGAIVARTISGGVDIEGSGNVDVHTTSGGVEVDGSGGDSRIDTVSGDVTFTGACGAGCTRRITTVSGDVSLETEDAGSFTLRFDTTSGEMSGELVRNERARELRVGNGAGQVMVRTISGALTVD